MNQRRSFFVLTMMAFGFAFLYIPILSLIAYSFNESRLVTVWKGFSTKWYVELFHNDAILNAAKLSLKIATVNATGATILGTMAGLALARFGRFRSRSLLAGLTTAPLVMPEVITGLSMLLLFVAMEQIFGWPGLGWLTIQAITQRDYAVVQGTVLLSAFVFVAVNLLVDIGYAVLDPRIRHARS